MTEPTSARQRFPESRRSPGLLSRVLGIFFAGCVYFVCVWQPATVADHIAQFAVEDILFTFITPCMVGLIASVAGPHRIRPLILRVGGRAARAGLALVLGTVVYVLYCWLT